MSAPQWLAVGEPQRTSQSWESARSAMRMRTHRFTALRKHENSPRRFTALREERILAVIVARSQQLREIGCIPETFAAIKPYMLQYRPRIAAAPPQSPTGDTDDTRPSGRP
jgi:hypothetical protein